MKRTVLFAAWFLLAIALASASRPLAAQGIVSDEVWQLVDHLLQDADSPHLNIDFDDVMGRMSIVADDDGNLFLMTSIVAYPQEVNEYTAAIEEALSATIPSSSGQARSVTGAAVQYEIVALDQDSVEILLFEQLGVR